MMLNKVFRFFPVVFVLFGSCISEDETTLRIATAANVQFAMHELCEEFENETGINTEIIIGSSGKLTAQIEQGAPFDVFVSADMFFPHELFSHGYSLKEPEIYAYGQLVLWSMKEGLHVDISMLKSDQVKHIAMANPKTAPYGKAAMEILESFEILDNIKHKLVYGESISQTNQFIMSGTAEIGFTAISAVLSPQMKGQGSWELVDVKAYSPIAQGVVVVNRDEENQKAEEFYNFLFSEKAKTIFGKYQYLIRN